MRTLLHLSIPIHDTKQAERFDGERLGCRITRCQIDHFDSDHFDSDHFDSDRFDSDRFDSDRFDIDFFGHHLLGPLFVEEASRRSIDIGKDQYPLRHVGVIVQQPVYDQLLESLTQAKVPFAMQPTQVFQRYAA